jgi:hypothetical protein
VLIKSVNVIDSFASPGAIGSWWKKREKSRYSKCTRRDSWKSGTNTGTLLLEKRINGNSTRQSKAEIVKPNKSFAKQI